MKDIHYKRALKDTDEQKGSSHLPTPSSYAHMYGVFELTLTSFYF